MDTSKSEETRINSQLFHSLRIIDLKIVLKMTHQKVSGNKGVLVDRLVEYTNISPPDRAALPVKLANKLRQRAVSGLASTVFDIQLFDLPPPEIEQYAKVISFTNQ